jgi:hypothetical protein
MVSNVSGELTASVFREKHYIADGKSTLLRNII